MESKIEEIDVILCNPQLYDNHEKIIELTRNRENLKISLDILYDKWILLTEE